MTMYQELKKLNPAFPILVRECSGIQARMTARYGKSVDLVFDYKISLKVDPEVYRLISCILLIMIDFL